MCNMHVYIVINTAFIYDFKKDLCSLVLKKRYSYRSETL